VIFGGGKIAKQLEFTNAYLALIADALQNSPALLRMPAPTKPKLPDTLVAKVDFPPEFRDASELLARWLWLQLPEDSKKDLST
jgi:hypothetical protein